MAQLDLWAFDGGNLKALDDQGRFEGLAVPFGDADLSDHRDRFTKATNFGRAMKTGSDLLYYHGLPTVGPREKNPLADRLLGEAAYKTTDAGVWAEGQIKLRDEYETKVWEMVQAGKCGLSTGVAAHRVRRDANADGTHSVKAWPSDELSFTPSPAHHRTSVYAVKSLLEDGFAGELKGVYLGADSERRIAGSAMSTLSGMAYEKVQEHLGNETMSHTEKMAACKGVMDEHASVAMKMIHALHSDPEGGGPEVKALLDSFRASSPLPEPAESAGFVSTLKKAESALLWAIGRELTGAKSQALKTLAESVQRCRSSRLDTAQIAAARAKCDRLLTHYQG